MVALALLALLLVAGCGSDDSEGSSGEVSIETGSLSKAEFIKQANEICGDAQEQIITNYGIFVQQNPGAATGKAGEATAAELVETVVVPSYEKEIEEISELGAPEGDEEELNAYFEEIQRELEKSTRQPYYVVNREFLTKASQMARDYGLEVCGGGGA